MAKDNILVPIRALLTLLFMYASFSKIFDPEVFQRSMYKQPFPHWVSDILMIFIPASEIIIAVFLISSKRWQLGLKLSLVLMTVFSLYIIVILLHGFGHVPCSCGGVISSLNWSQHLVFNLFFVAISLGGVLLTRNMHDEYARIPRGRKLSRPAH